MSGDGYQHPAMAGSGTIACGLAACASTVSKTVLLARSDASAWKAEEQATMLCAKIDGGEPGNVKVTTDPGDLADCDLIVEAITEEVGPKAELLRTLASAVPGADLATTTSSLSIHAVADACGQPERLFGLHPFNPVTRMDLVELCVPQQAAEAIGPRARAWCEAMGKTVVEVPDEVGFVVNRLLFPYLFDAVHLLSQTGMPPEDVDRCMTLGAGYPMGPLALLDLIGLDIAVAIGDAIYAETSEEHHRPPGRLIALVGEGKFGRKSGAGFYEY